VTKAFGELDLIQQIRSEQIRSQQIRASRSAGAGKRTRANSSVVLGIGDDCAILRPPCGHEILVTTDFSLEGRHFLRNIHPPESIGHRVLARGLSDLAAMGAKPLAAFLSLALPSEMPATRSARAWLARFFAGFNALARQYSVPLAGGDTSESPSPNILADIVLVGSAPAGRALRRAGSPICPARAGDALYVTGALGGSAAEFAALREKGRLASARTSPDKQKGINPHPHLYPQPRLAVGQALLCRKLATACIDLSDGLSTDLAHLCYESHLGAEIDAAALPIHPLAARAANADKENAPLALALHGGEDYELLFSARESARIPRAIAGVPITRVGRLTRGKAIELIDASGHPKPLIPRGWEHFRT
jgi:thiamine-monophosphate kinase